MGPRGPSRAPKYQKPTFAKTLKNHWFFKVFGGPRPSKTASKDPKSLPRGYLGLLEAILSHLGAILEIRAFKIAPVIWDCEWWHGFRPMMAHLESIWSHLGSHFGTKAGQEEPR